MCLRFVCRKRSDKREILVIHSNGALEWTRSEAIAKYALSFTYQPMLFVVHFEGLT
jgi:hypothetical protein